MSARDLAAPDAATATEPGTPSAGRGVSLTVAVVELAGGEALLACVEAVRALAAPSGAEVLVALRGAPPAAASGPSPGIGVLPGAGRTVPRRRAAAVAAAAGDVVALVEDTTRPDPGWLDAVVDAFCDTETAAASGPVRISGTLPARHRALCRLEYGRFAPAARAAAAPAGNCMAFRRAALRDVLDDAGLVEHEAAARLSRRGWRIAFVPAMTSCYAMPDAHGARLAVRFGHGRLYAAARHRGAVGRALGALRSLLVPPALALRAARATPPAALPAEFGWIVLMACAWGVGETAGCLLGRGRSDESWR